MENEKDLQKNWCEFTETGMENTSINSKISKKGENTGLYVLNNERKLFISVLFWNENKIWKELLDSMFNGVTII